MPGVRRLEYVRLRVTDLEAAAAFYRDVLGFVELARDDVVVLGCGLDGNVDLVLAEGGTGLDRFAIRAGEASLTRHEERLVEAGVETERREGTLPGVRRAVDFDLPSGRLSMSIVEMADSRYHNPADVGTLPTSAPVHPDRSPLAPVDLSHVTAMTPDIEADVAFLRDVVGLHASDIGLSPAEDWVMAFLRSGDYHHDVALFDDPEHSLHHVAWEYPDVSGVVRVMDHVVSNGLQFQAGPVRHGPGSNIAAYFMSPGGNRVELATELVTVGPGTAVEFHDVTEVPFSIWGGQEPGKTFREGT